ncbi:MAG: hypothetical protein Q4B28_02410 [bacterium]|nr:hypothetical protein [bacterium]
MKKFKQKILFCIGISIFAFLSMGIISIASARSDQRNSDNSGNNKDWVEEKEAYRKTDEYKKCREGNKTDEHCLNGGSDGVTVVGKSAQKPTCKPIKLNTYFPFL